jgi:Domain of unknown function (DUF4276)
MNIRRFTLLAEGSSDRVLLPIIRWMLSQHHAAYEWSEQLANLSALPVAPRSLSDRISASINYFPSDILFVHRDSDNASVESRVEEIRTAFANNEDSLDVICIPIIPVRMTEAWLLISEPALRASVDNRNSRVALNLPSINNIEVIANPKQLLEEKLLMASELTGRRRKKFHFPAHRARIPDSIDNWNRLLELPSARRLYNAIGQLSFPCY